MKTIKELEKIIEILDLNKEDIKNVDYINYKLADNVFDYLANTYYFNKDKGLNIFLEDKIWEIDNHYNLLKHTNDIIEIKTWEDLVINVLDNIINSLKPIAIYGISNNSGIMIYDIEDDIVIYSHDGLNFQSSKVEYNIDDELYFKADDYNIPLDECIRTNY